MPYPYEKNQYKPKNGAKEGLEKKMEYWKDKDYQFEYGVMVGQALNLASGRPNSVLADLKDDAYAIFKIALDCKLDENFIALFNEYYGKKKHYGEASDKIAIKD